MEANKIDEGKLHLVRMWFRVYGKMTNPELRDLGIDYPYSYVTRLINDGYSIESEVKTKKGNPYWLYTLK
jgi:hypothetical protein